MKTKHAKTIRDAIFWANCYADRLSVRTPFIGTDNYINPGDSPLWLEAFKRTLKRRGFFLVGHRVFLKSTHLPD